MMSTPIKPDLHFSCHDYSPSVNSTLYYKLIGGLIYLAYTKPNICYIVSYLSRFMHEPKKAYLIMEKHILRYILGIDDYIMKYNNILSGYTNIEYEGSLDDRRSMTGYVFFLRSRLISWGSKKQSIKSKSTTKSEYHATGDAIYETIWLCHILIDIRIP